jgi:hypothetical protein
MNIENVSGGANLKTDAPTSARQQTSEENLARLLSEARRRFICTYPEQDFKSQCWDTTEHRDRPGGAGASVFTFSVLSVARKRRRALDTEDALPAHFINAIKAWIVLDEEAALGTNLQRLVAAKHFWNFLSSMQKERAVAFQWGSLIESDLQAFEQYLIGYRSAKDKPLSASSILSAISSLQELANFLWLRGVCRRIQYYPQTRVGGAKPLAEREKDAEKKLPDPGALEALADIYHRVTTAPEGEVPVLHQIFISAVAILPFTGFRPIELLTLPYDCEVEESVVGRGGRGDRYGLRYWPAKKRGTFPDVKWVSPTAEPLVRECVGRIKRLTAEARQRAAILEADPCRVPLPPDLQEAYAMGTRHVAEILGYKSISGVTRIPEGELPRQIHEDYKKQLMYFPQDVEQYLLGQQVKNLYTVRHDDGTVQRLSESLLITFTRLSSHSDTHCRLLVEPISYRLLERFFCYAEARGHHGAFSLYGATPEDKGRSLNLNSSRHWLNHVAYKGALEENLLARYFARTSPQASRAYLHYTPPQVGEYVREEIRANRVFGPVALTYWSLPEEQRDDYLLGQAGIAHFTPWGLCLRNFALKPCDKHLNCLNDCSSFHSRKGDQREVKALQDLWAKTAALLEVAKKAAAKGEPYADNWVNYNRRKLAKIEEVLAFHAGTQVEEGESARPFKEGKDLSTKKGGGED